MHNKIICPHCLREIYRNENFMKTQAKRRKLIIKLLDDKVSVTQFYRLCRTHGYPQKRKTFHRDLQVLSEVGLVKIQETMNEPRGLSSYVVPV